MTSASENRENTVDDNQEEAAHYCLQEAWLEYNKKLALRNKNLLAKSNRPDPDTLDSLADLDSTIKKNSSFVKKLRSINDSSKESLTLEFEGLNLTRYLQEAANSILEGKFKSGDISSVVFICGNFHSRYSEFINHLYLELSRLYSLQISKDEDKGAVSAKYRLGLRLVGELALAGLLTNYQAIALLTAMLKSIFIFDKMCHCMLPVILSFTKHFSEEILGIPPKKHIFYGEKFMLKFPRIELLSKQCQEGISCMLLDYAQEQKKYLLSLHNQLGEINIKNKQLLQTKGEIPEDRRDEQDKAMKNYDKYLANLTSFLDVLSEDLPNLPSHDSLDSSPVSDFEIYSSPNDLQCTNSTISLWIDEEERSFYESFPNLKASMPGILFETSTPNIDNLKEEEILVEDPDKLLQEIIKNEELQSNESPISTLEGQLVDDDDCGVHFPDKLNPSKLKKFDTFLNILQKDINRQLIDNAATEFITEFNIKANRKRLISTLIKVPRSRLDLVPFYARFIATLYLCISEIGQEVVISLIREFKRHVGKKDQINIESKIKNVRFIGELTKFRICKKADTLRCLSVLIFDFSYHYIEMACALLENCGRFLYNSPDSQPRTKVLLDTMLRKKSALHLDPHYINLIDNALYYTQPSEQLKKSGKELSPMLLYIEKLLYKDLNKMNVPKAVKQFRKLPWKDNKIFTFAVQALSRPWRVKFNNIYLLASLLAGLVPYQNEVGIHVVDAVLEEIRLGLEINDPRLNQQRLSTIKYLGELYCYKLIESTLVFKLLYLIMNFGRQTVDAESNLDPCDNYFRIRMICTLLDVCGQYFDYGSNRIRLDYFFIFFQRYLFTKLQPIPVYIEFNVSDIMETLRPDVLYYDTFEEACEATKELEEQFEKQLKNLSAQKEEENCLQSSGNYTSSALKSEDEDDCDEHKRNLLSCDASKDLVDDQSESDGSDTEVDQDDDEIDVIPTCGVTHYKCPEDDDFIATLEKSMTDDLQNRKSETIKIQSADIAIPMKLRGPSSLKPGQSNDALSEHLSFTLMLKKGHKPQFKEIKIPEAAPIATSIKQQREAEMNEHEERKKIILSYEKRREEEDYQAQQHAENEQERLKQKRLKSKGYHSYEFNRSKLESRKEEFP